MAVGLVTSRVELQSGHINSYYRNPLVLILFPSTRVSADRRCRYRFGLCSSQAQLQQHRNNYSELFPILVSRERPPVAIRRRE
jgi:hypothetical protein